MKFNLLDFILFEMEKNCLLIFLCPVILATNEPYLLRKEIVWKFPEFFNNYFNHEIKIQKIDGNPTPRIYLYCRYFDSSKNFEINKMLSEKHAIELLDIYFSSEPKFVNTIDCEKNLIKKIIFINIQHVDILNYYQKIYSSKLKA